jgi:anti-sigma factor RsiW
MRAFELLCAYLDDALEPVDRAEVEFRLATEPGFAAMLEAITRGDDALRGAFALGDTADIPDRFATLLGAPMPVRQDD